jgi:hypothetical protein
LRFDDVFHVFLLKFCTGSSQSRILAHKAAMRRNAAAHGRMATTSSPSARTTHMLAPTALLVEFLLFVINLNRIKFVKCLFKNKIAKCVINN